MYLRFFSRLQLLIAFIITCSVSYAVWTQSSALESALTRTWSSQSRIVVTFGDSSSRVKKARTYLNTGLRPKEEDDFVAWSEVLRQKIGYDIVQNYAQNAANRLAAVDFDMLTDNEIYLHTTLYNDTSSPLPLDLKQQVQKWTRDFGRVIPGRFSHHYVFTITVGFWDVWVYSRLDLENAKTAILASVHSLFEQLRLIDSTMNGNATVVIPALWDVSFSPKFMSGDISQNLLRRRGYSEKQHKLVYLVQYWNLALTQHAANWQGSDLYIPDWNTWLLDQIRSTQMRRVGISDAEGLGAGATVFKDVLNPCSRTVSINEASDALASQCASPRQHLWWDDVHFGPVAHEMLGEVAANMVGTNETANADIPQPSATNTNSPPDFIPHLVPSLAPGN